MKRIIGALLVFVIVVLAALIVIGLLHHDEGEKKKAKPKTVTTRVDTGDRGRAPDKKIVAPVEAVRENAIREEHTQPGDVPPSDSTPPGVPPAEIKRGLDQALDNVVKLPEVLPLASPTVPGCLTRFVRRSNYGAVRNTEVKFFVVHWSGGPNRLGWDDVEGLTAFGNNPTAGVSWTLNMDRQGHCHYNTPALHNPYTQAGHNRWSLSVEIINVGGRDKPLLTAHGLKVLGRAIAFFNRKFKFGLRRGQASGCRVVRPGIVMHADLGVCGGNHPDVGDNSLAPIINAARAADAKYYAPRRVTATDRLTCRRINWWRSHGRHHGKPERNAIRRRVALQKRGIVCTRRGATKR